MLSIIKTIIKTIIKGLKCPHDWELQKQIVREDEFGISITYYFICKKCGKTFKRKVYQ